MPIETLFRSDPGGDLFRRTVHTALSCLEPQVRARPKYRRHAVWERLAMPDRVSRFPVIWMDDGGRVRADRGYLAGYNGPAPAGRLILRAGLTEGDVLSLAFLERLMACLCSLPDGGILIWGVDRDPAPLSDGESMRLCRGLLNGLKPCMHRLPAETLPLTGAPERERDHLAGALGLPAPNAPLTPEQAAGIGLGYFAEAALRGGGWGGLDGRTVAVDGKGPLAHSAARMAKRLGARVLRRERHCPGAGTADVYFLCEPGAPLDSEAARALAAARPVGIFEGAPLACLPEAAQVLDRPGLLFAPAIAAGSGARRAGAAATAWEAERLLRNDMGALCRELLAQQPDRLFPAACSLALCGAADILLRRGVV